MRRSASDFSLAVLQKRAEGGDQVVLCDFQSNRLLQIGEFLRDHVPIVNGKGGGERKGKLRESASESGREQARDPQHYLTFLTHLTLHDLSSAHCLHVGMTRVSTSSLGSRTAMATQASTASRRTESCSSCAKLWNNGMISDLRYSNSTT